jgi:7-keto-8-aminopelargonate synthetase-like enzyme
VPAATSRLRITVTAGHTAAQIDALVDALAGLWPSTTP